MNTKVLENCDGYLKIVVLLVASHFSHTGLPFKHGKSAFLIGFFLYGPLPYECALTVEKFCRIRERYYKASLIGSFGMGFSANPEP